ncbi:MAG: aldehyde ferredoxin oxidoreductase [Deltaproteobacteria bacterium]|nr:aldehyde ferredoxin oxidoreductase [Deltaproteobacteria bacterium]
MIRDHFRVLVMDLAAGKGKVVRVDGRDEVAGGSGLGALLFAKYGRIDKPWDDPEQPVIFTIGPLTGYFPLMSKTVAAFKSPYHDQYAESHAGGRSALALKFADLDALVLTGKAPRPSALVVGSRHLELKEVHYLWGKDIQESGKLLRRMFKGSGHRSILRIGPAGENKSAMAGINVDTYRHFGRLGGGAALGAKNIKAVVIIGDGSFPLMEGKDYPRLFQAVYEKLTATDMMQKYHNLGTPVNVAVLNKLKALPWRNLQATSDENAHGISGERFAETALLRNAACAGCPVGCIHIGFSRERFQTDHRFFYRQVSYDHEPIFAAGSMLGVTDCFAVLDILDVVEQMGLDVMSAGVALAWATEALEKGVITEKETLLPLRFGDHNTYEKAVQHLAYGVNDFYRLLAQGTLKAAAHYGGADFACVLGQEMAGYATGEVFFASQALGFRHSHLDAGGYAYDQKHDDQDVGKAVEFLVTDEASRAFLTSMVACLFARGVYTDELLAECLQVVGYGALAGSIDAVSRRIQQLRWQTRLATGFDPAAVSIPKRFTEVVTWKGKVDGEFLAVLKNEYARRIAEMARREDHP